MTRRTRTPERRSRSWQVPISVAVIIISAVVIWQLAGGLFDGDPTPPEPDAEVTAFWVDGARDLREDWFATSPDIVQDILTGSDCLVGVEIKAAICPDLHDRYEGYRMIVQSLIARGNALDRPEDSTADEWMDTLVLAWTNLDESLAGYAQLGLAGYEPQPWIDHLEDYRQTVVAGFTEAEIALGRMLIEVEPDQISPAAP